MSKEQDILNLLSQTKIEEMHIEQEMKESFMSYAMSVNISRAIPDARDGLKPVHRRILYAMHEQGITYDKSYRKCAKAVGDVMGKYHPHGDSSIYDALVRLAQNFSINEPLVDGHGNFGSVDGDGAAASRYTEARLSKISNEMLKDIEKDTVDFVPNYDGEEMEPTVLPARFPNLLVNGSNGIAVGMATNIPPHNLGEVIDGVVALIDNPEISCEELIDYVPAPDFPTRGIIMGTKGIRKAYLTGRGNIVLRSKAIIEEESDTNKYPRIIFTEIPYQVNKKKAIRQALDLIKNKETEDIHYVRDESDREGIRVVVELKKGASPEVVLNMLYKRTQFQISDGIIFLALDNNQPKLLNLKEMLSIYLEHQIQVITRRSNFDLAKAQERAHILDGLVLALANIDDIIATIKASADRQEALANLTTRFNLSEKQASAILDMRLQRLTGLEKEKLEEELRNLKAFIEELNILLSSRTNILAKVKEELLEIKHKYATPRKSEIGIDYSDINIGDLIKKQDVVITISHSGYIKRMPVDEYKAQNRGGRGVTGHKTKEEDWVENMFVTFSHDDLMFFSTKGKVYRIKAYEVPEASKTAKGRAIINLLELDKENGESIQSVLPVKPNTEGYMIIATKNGLIKKTAVEEFASIRKNGKIAIKLNEDDQVINVGFTSGNDEILVASHEGKCIRFNETDVRATGRDTMGVKSMNLNSDDYVVDMTVIKPESEFITITENGYGKRSIVDDYRLQSRGGKGVKAGTFNKKTGKLVNLKQVTGEEDIMLIADNGIIIRMHTDSINTISRTTQGVRLMKLNNGAKVMCMALSEREEEHLEDVSSEENTEQPVEITENIEE